MKAPTGNMTECLRHLCALAQRNETLYRQIKEAMQQFFAVSDAAGRWLKQEYDPSGLNLIRMRYFLEACGYKVQELIELDRTVYDLGLMIACNIVTLEDVVSELEIKKRETLFGNLNGKSRPSAENLAKMHALVTAYHDVIKEITALKVIPKLSFEEDAATAPVVQPARAADRAAKPAPATLVEQLADLIRQAIPLADQLLSDKYTAEDRRRLRSLLDDDGVHILQNQLTRLSSEKSREMVEEFRHDGKI